MGDFIGAFPSSSYKPPPKETPRTRYIRAHNLLKPVLQILSSSPPHLLLSSLTSLLIPSPPLSLQAKLLRLLSSFLSPTIQPVRSSALLQVPLRNAIDRFDASLLTAFDSADSSNDEKSMKEAAYASWSLSSSSSNWEMGKMWAEKREIFYAHSLPSSSSQNFLPDNTLDFEAMDEFMSLILDSIAEHGSRAVRVFPPSSGVLIAFAEKLAGEVVSEYVTSLLTRARNLGTGVYLRCVAAAFKESWKMVDAIMLAAEENKPDSEVVVVTRTRAEDVVYQMFEENMDEYLDEEVEALKSAFDGACKEWNRGISSPTPTPTTPSSTPFTSSQNPALIKRNVLASFTNLLLLPVTIVPRAVGGVGQGIAMLNPQRWGSGGAAPAGNVTNGGGGGYSKTLFNVDEAEEEEEEHVHDAPNPLSPSITSPTPLVSASQPSPTLTSTANLDLLLSLDLALNLIHLSRSSLKRVESFSGYPGHYGGRVRDTIEEVFIALLGVLGEGHVVRGFDDATQRMKSYKPSEHSETANVAPLVQFFELVHIGDTIQSMVQVYFEKELAPHIDKTDFLNAVVREKKRFENSLDDSVAAGLNAGTEVLMNQVDHVIVTLTKPREYYPPEDGMLELGPTRGCQEAIKCLETHCKLLKGSTSKEVLEVFYQEVGIRLIAILQKHIKRQIISLNGGFQVIADLNAYNAFISSLKVPAITADFSHLKMLGHVFVVEDAKDLAQIVRDVTRYGGAYRPEDVYEFIQRRSDWKKIEKIVDKTMYNLSFKEDCIIA
ncbi:uncharacterized protein LACBIDRAFT_248167 [Laccaria bicolor S238N-H82]|uniref:Predicted protein n=1 Tax=Laccaria bicolor (strain S238N-H82 / ATCC MYA-4686) TaxID=486041 RepID=B0D585_LACBS|nr:uncharacterized protein LACBIDRAFT_248167 [Laccaria bicolor S238N-H82]EDR10470.1 predicted protein [Laccaria bicolor S238N-H82]|eukprot:XP_001878920.1 predicted protein [Laccaria bicolor S238N-H82]